MKLLRIAAALLLLVGSAHAQSLTNILPDTPSKTPEELEREQALERDYKDSLKKIPDGKASNDPWGNVRGAEKPSPQGKTSAVRADPAKSRVAKPQ